MSYHKFPNLGQQFQSELTSKLTKDLRSMDFMDLLCNCNKASKIDGKCMYKGDCQKSIVVYNVKCKLYDMSYFGDTQQKLKICIKQHLDKVCALVNKGKIPTCLQKKLHGIIKIEKKNWRRQNRNILGW